MRHIMMSSAWEFSTEPFPAYRANLVYGRNKRDREFLPVQGMTPIITYTVAHQGDRIGEDVVVFTGTDEVDAEAAKVKAEAEQKAKVADGSASWPRSVYVKASLPTLPDGQFRVIKTKEKGTILIVPGDDNTNRCLLFVGCAGGFRGGVGVIKSDNPGTILKECSAGNACESSTEVIVLLEPSQTVAFHASGRRTNEVYLYTWNGVEMEKKHFSKSEWDSRNAVATPPIEDAEVL